MHNVTIDYTKTTMIIAEVCTGKRIGVMFTIDVVTQKN